MPDQTSDNVCDITVIGGGLAGKAASLHLARAGLRVICIEPSESGRQPVGESLDWSSPELLKALGLPMDELIQYAFHFQERVDRLVLLSPAMFPDLKPFSLFRLLRIPVIGELLAPIINAIFWNVAMRYALEKPRKEWRSVVTDFHAPFTGLLGAWRLMSVLRFGDPTEVLAAVPAMLPHLQVPTLIFHGSRDKAIPQGFALRASALIPDSKVILLDSGHFIPLSNPDAIAKELLVFFARSVTAQVA
jgi:hypothetical protein